MNAFNKVNLAASCIVTSAAYATELGIPESKWIYPLGGAGTQDSDKCKLILHNSSMPGLTGMSHSLAAPKLPLEPIHFTLNRRLSRRGWLEKGAD